MRPQKPITQILPALIAHPKADWRLFLQLLDTHHVTSIALILEGLATDERRALYRQLEGTCLEEIPHVHIDAQTEEWELDYLSARYKTRSFGVSPSPTLSGLLATLPHYTHLIAIKGPVRKSGDTGFTQEILRSIGAPGVVLDTAAFERERIHDHKAHQNTVAILDHFNVACTYISITPSYWQNIVSSLTPPRTLTSLKQLRYLRHLPPNCFGSFVVLELDNRLDEMLEVKSYLDFLTTTIV